MYQAVRKAGGVGDHYRTIDLTSKIEGASPHRLISILYEELVLSMAGMKMAMRRQERVRLNESHARALSIVQTLDASLDHDKGGDIAGALSSVYGEVSRLINIAHRDNAPEGVDKAQKLIAEISDAWNKIG